MNAGRGRAIGLVLSIAVVVSLAAVAPAGADSTNKPYLLVVGTGSPTYNSVAGVVASGETVGITATFTNNTATQQLGSANLFAPSGFSVLSASASPVGMATLGSNCSLNGKPHGPCVQLRSLALSPGQSVTVTMSVTTPACQSGGYAWKAEVKQANDFNGSPGNDLSLDPNSQPDTTLDGACSLKFGTEPADAQTGQPITGTAFTPTGPPLTVNVLDRSSQPVTGSTLPVKLGVGANPGLASIGGAPTQPAAGGTASFSDVTLNRAGNGYTLTASSAPSGTLSGDTSSHFNIQDQAVFCSTPGPCALTDGTPNGNKAQVVATVPSGSSGELTESVNPDAGSQLTCTGYTSVDPNTYESFAPAAWGKVVTLTIVPAKKLSGKANQILNGQQICFGAPISFTTLSGTPAGAGTLPDGSSGFIGLLQTCTGSTVGPCHDRQADTTVADPNSPNGFDLVLVYNVPAGWAGDPWGR